MGVHKGRGLEWLAHHLGCTLANVIAIGDSENDLTTVSYTHLDVYKRQDRVRAHGRGSFARDYTQADGCAVFRH